MPMTQFTVLHGYERETTYYVRVSDIGAFSGDEGGSEFTDVLVQGHWIRVQESEKDIRNAINRPRL